MCNEADFWPQPSVRLGVVGGETTLRTSAREAKTIYILQSVVLLADPEWSLLAFAAEPSGPTRSDDIVILPHVWVERHGADAAQSQQRTGQCFWPPWDVFGSAYSLCSLHTVKLQLHSVCLALTCCSPTYCINTRCSSTTETGWWNQG